MKESYWPSDDTHRDGEASHSFAAQEILRCVILLAEETEVYTDKNADEQQQTEERVIEPSER